MNNIILELVLDKKKIKEVEDGMATALEMTAEAVVGMVRDDQVIPRKDGALQGEQFFSDTKKSKKGIVSLVHATPYARRLYYHPEYNFNTLENPNARGKWYTDYMKSGKKVDEIKQIYGKFLKMHGGV